MAVVHILKNWFLTLDGVWDWVSSSLLPVLKLGPDEKQAVLDWVSNYVTQPPTDFSGNWRDGILLCELADKFAPELFHGLGILDPKNCFHNVSLALEIIKGSFEIDPGVTPEDIVTCAPEAEEKLFNLLLKIKEKVKLREAENEDSLNETNSGEDELGDSTENDCFAQGTGLVIGFLGRKASFIVFSNGSFSDPDLVVDIKGPYDTHCCERITKRSPKCKCALPQSATPRPRISQCGRSQSQTELWKASSLSKKDPKLIPLEYEIKDDFISVGYVPLQRGPHTITVLWHGRYVTGSPFIAVIEDSFGNRSDTLKPPILRKEALTTTAGPKKPSVSFKEQDTNHVKLGKVRSRRVLRYIIKIGKKDIVVDAESSDMLAPALRKLDLPNEGISLGPRRNSWGFVGDVHSHRRLSLMRQLGIDNSDEVQDRPQKRSSSFTVPFDASTSEDDTTNDIFTSSGTFLLSNSSNEPSNLRNYKHDGNNISTLKYEDFNEPKKLTSPKFPTLATVREGEVQFASVTSNIRSETAETYDKISSSEVEVIYKEELIPVSESNYETKLMTKCEISSKDSADISWSANSLDLDPQLNASEVVEAVTLTKNEGVVQNEMELQHYSTSILETHSPPTEMVEKEFYDKQIGNVVQQTILSNEITKEHQNLTCYTEFFSYFNKEGTHIHCAHQSAMGKLPSKEETVIADSRNCSSFLNSLEDPVVQRVTLRDIKEATTDSSSKTHSCSPKYTSGTTQDAQGKVYDGYRDTNQIKNVVEKDCDTKATLCEQTLLFCESNPQSQAEDHVKVAPANVSKAISVEMMIASASNVGYYNECNYEDTSVKQNIYDKKIGDGKISDNITLLSGTNAKEFTNDQGGFHVKKGENFLDEVQSKNFQWYYGNGRVKIPLTSESEDLLPPHETLAAPNILSLNRDDMSSEIKQNYGSIECSNCNKCHHQSFSNGKGCCISQDIGNHRTESIIVESETHAPESANRVKTEYSLKCGGKTRRMLSHPYLKSSCHRTENSNLHPVSNLSGKETSVTQRTDASQFPYPSGMTRSPENKVFQISNSESQEAPQFFKWPGVPNIGKNSLLNCENMVSPFPKIDKNGFDKDDKTTNEISKEKPVVGDSLKFSLRSYKDEHLSACEEELVSSASVKAIVKNFHEKSVEYPASRADKMNDIYLRRSFFPPLAANEDRKTVRKHISKWEKSPSMPETENFVSGSNTSSVHEKLSLYVNVQSKVAFWENAYHVPESGEIPGDDTCSGIYPNMSVPAQKDIFAEVKQREYAGFDSVRCSNDTAVPSWKAQQQHMASSSRPVTSERTEDSGISDDLLVCLKTSDHKRPPVFSTQRSLSDPCIQTCSTRPTDLLSNFEENLNIVSSSLFCSSDVNADASSNESEDANDEYIDDEIPDYAAMFLGDYISFTGLLGPERSSLRKEAVTQYLEKLEDNSRHIFDPSLSRPHECRALGVGVHYGLVSMNNHFQVLTKGAGRGNLSISIQGSGMHDVTKVIVTYSRNDIYDVIYQVLEPGYYIISVRWSDWSIPGSPFICKVTY